MTTKRRIKTAFLPGAGLGTRLRPLTDALPKPLLPLNGRPVITYALEALARVGIERFIVNTHHLPDEYPKHFPQGNWRGLPLSFVHEETLLDTAGGLKNIEPLVAAEEDIIIHNADIVSSLPLAPLLERHLAGEALATLALRSSGPLLNVALSPDGFITDIRGALGSREIKLYQFTGISAVRRGFWEGITSGRAESLADTLIGMLWRRERTVAGIVIDGGTWSDMGTLAEYDRLRREDVNDG